MRNYKNEATANLENSLLTQALIVQPINSTNLDTIINKKSKQGILKSPYSRNTKVASNYESYKRQEKTEPKNSLSSSEKNIPKTTGKKVRMPLRSYKHTVDVEVPDFGGGQAIIAPKLPPFLRLPKPDTKISKETFVEQPVLTNIVDQLKGMDKQEIAVSLLEDANEMVNISNAQLEEIQNLLKTKKIQKPPQIGNTQYETKWNVSGKKENHSSSSKYKALSTLQNLNNRLQNMQQKFFGQSKINDRSDSPKMIDSGNKTRKFSPLVSKFNLTEFNKYEDFFPNEEFDFYDTSSITETDYYQCLDNKNFEDTNVFNSLSVDNRKIFYDRFATQSKPNSGMVTEIPEFKSDDYQNTTSCETTKNSNFVQTKQKNNIKSEYLTKSFNKDPTCHPAKELPQLLSEEKKEILSRMRPDDELQVKLPQDSEKLYLSLNKALENSFYGLAVKK